MHRKSLFFVWFASAAITFGGLWFGLGQEHFNRGHRMCHPMMERHCMMKEMDEKNLKVEVKDESGCWKEVTLDYFNSLED